MLRDENIQIIEIKYNYDNYQIQNFFGEENDLQQFKELIKGGFNFKGCIIKISNDNNDGNNNDYLYISVGEKIGEKYNESKIKNIIIIDLSQRKIIKNIHINIKVCSILNWNNKYLILATEQSLYIFDTRINKIISKYSNLSGEKTDIKTLKALFSLKNNFYSLFIQKGYIIFFTSK